VIPAFTDDPGDPVFMVSYARSRLDVQAKSPYQVDQHVLQFYNDLNGHMAELTPMKEIGQAPGFLDMTVGTGDDWEKDLRHAAGSCQILICLLSPRYLTRSEWCAMEWHIYSQRKIVIRKNGEPAPEKISNIVPVTWLPVMEEIPEMVNKVTRFSPLDLPHPDFQPQYQANGLAGLLNSRQINAYDAIVWTLAKYIQKRCAAYWVEPNVPDSLDGLPRSFREEPK
jgi:hypothetical protein